jgi:hypothetical protein
MIRCYRLLREYKVTQSLAFRERHVERWLYVQESGLFFLSHSFNEFNQPRSHQFSGSPELETANLSFERVDWNPLYTFKRWIAVDSVDAKTPGYHCLAVPHYTRPISRQWLEVYRHEPFD